MRRRGPEEDGEGNRGVRKERKESCERKEERKGVGVRRIEVEKGLGCRDDKSLGGGTVKVRGKGRRRGRE